VAIDQHLTRLAESLAGLAPNVRIETDMAPLRVPVDVASPLNLIANELITNALQHAFPRGATGRVIVRLSSEGGRARLTVRDDGVGPAPGFPDGSIGTELVDGLARQIGAEVRRSALPSGFEVEITMP
jgi:two-component sensor histidine kinase